MNDEIKPDHAPAAIVMQGGQLAVLTAVVRKILERMPEHAQILSEAQTEAGISQFAELEPYKKGVLGAVALLEPTGH